MTHDSFPRIAWPLLCLAIWTIAGCGAAPSFVPRESAKASLQQGREALAKGNFAEADSALRSAIDSRGLQPDDLCDAMTLRSRALAQLDRFDEAHALLDQAAQGAADLAAIHATRAEVFRRQGKAALADRAFADAKKLNPQIRPTGK
jgi:tetratricopeptide (TPR) repeat protein